MIARFPTVCRLLLALVLIILATLIAGAFTTKTIKAYFPFLHTIALVGVTWLLCRIDGRSLSDYGLSLSLRHSWLLPLGLIIGAASHIGFRYVSGLFRGETLVWNSGADLQAIFYNLYVVLPACAIQRLMFTGYPFRLCEKSWGLWKANLLFIVLFTGIHVGDPSILLRPFALMWGFLMYGTAHLMFSTALVRTATLYFPIGIHWGYNWATQSAVQYTARPTTLLFVDNPNPLPYTQTETVLSSAGFLGLYLLITGGIWLLFRPQFAAPVASRDAAA